MSALVILLSQMRVLRLDLKENNIIYNSISVKNKPEIKCETEELKASLVS